MKAPVKRWGAKREQEWIEKGKSADWLRGWRKGFCHKGFEELRPDTDKPAKRGGGVRDKPKKPAAVADE